MPIHHAERRPHAEGAHVDAVDAQRLHIGGVLREPAHAFGRRRVHVHFADRQRQTQALFHVDGRHVAGCFVLREQVALGMRVVVEREQIGDGGVALHHREFQLVHAAPAGEKCGQRMRVADAAGHEFGR